MSRGQWLSVASSKQVHRPEQALGKTAAEGHQEGTVLEVLWLVHLLARPVHLLQPIPGSPCSLLPVQTCSNPGT